MMKYKKDGGCLIITDEAGNSFPVIAADLPKKIAAYKARQKQMFDRDQAEINKMQGYIKEWNKIPENKKNQL